VTGLIKSDFKDQYSKSSFADNLIRSLERLVSSKGKNNGEFKAVTIDFDDLKNGNVELKIGLKYDHHGYIIYDNLKEV
jgi:hypothetical protein